MVKTDNEEGGSISTREEGMSLSIEDDIDVPEYVPLLSDHKEDIGYGSTEAAATSQADTWQSKFFTPFANASQGVNLTWKDLSVFVPVKNKETYRSYKCVLNNVTGSVKQGTLLAIMGASGSGKTTLLNCLAQRLPSSNIINGELCVNGRPVVSSDMVDIAGFVYQDDLFIGTLTVKEHLTFMAKLKLSSTLSSKSIKSKVEEIMIEVGLQKCADTVIGTPGRTKGISGGERKRLAFAAEILTDPKLLFCDEPTSGLDSFMAQNLIGMLRTMTSHGKTIVCSIHQPSSELFAMFDRLLLLAEGRIAFFGSSKSALEFFASLELPCPSTFNPADHYIHSLAVIPGAEQKSRQQIRKVCDQYSVSVYSKDIELQVAFNAIHDNSWCADEMIRKPQVRANWFYQLWLLIWRGLIDSRRNPSIFTIRTAQKLFLGLIIGILYSNLQLNQKGIMDIMGIIFIFVTENTFPSIYGVLHVFPLELPIFLRENKNGLYRIDTYYISKMITLMPGFFVGPTIFILVTYWTIGLHNTVEAFMLTWVLIIITANTAGACGCCFSAVFESVSAAMTALVPFDYILMITAGLFINIATIPSYISWTQYLSWFRYANEGISIAQWKGIENITCEWGNEAPCVETGEEVLLDYGFNSGDMEWIIINLICLYFGFHLFGFVGLFRRSRKY